ncbi:J domain-containing protein [Hyphomicrobium sp.]|uniref:J domain-containing protein n=1 Tax=Hyphomicrobium sp. TaxID=82 RepID=UPI002D7740A5|nr:J domain-containing protein [Hyphomicrobium sp.]HET6388484.1 J domain-containing protein [Hyphomicrobium sp.]
MGALRSLASGLAVCLVLGCGAVAAEELVLPYSCTMDGGVPRLTPSEETTYRIIGPRQDMPFPSCSGSAAWTCETMMIYKFSIECAGQRVAWAKVAASAREVGVHLPSQLPAGYAPVSKLRGRFVFPGFGRTTTMPQVASQTLSADAVIEPAALRSESEPEQAPWITVVDPAAALVNTPASGNAWKVAGVLSMLLISMMAACLLLVRRRQLTSFEFLNSAARGTSRAAGLWKFVTEAFSRGASGFSRSYENWRAATAQDGDESDEANPLGHVHARLHEIEHLVASLPGDLLLRDVLASELDALYDRTADLGRRAAQLGPEKLRAAVRAITRDLDRIARIAQGAMFGPDDRATAAESDPPTTVFEAYRILGLNPDAPDAAVKKIVDALRMSWHPDHARDEADRRHREQRIKQINAAWDLLKVRPAAAA